MNTAMIAYKTMSFYVAYAPEAGLFSYGACFEEAVNGVTDELRDQETTREERNEQP
jgi:hypothetical protein